MGLKFNFMIYLVNIHATLGSEIRTMPISIRFRSMQSNTGRKQENRMRHRQNRIKPGKNTPKVTQAVAQGQEYTAFLGDSPARSQQALFEDNAVMNQFHAKINDLSLEEILLKT